MSIKIMPKSFVMYCAMEAGRPEDRDKFSVMVEADGSWWVVDRNFEKVAGPFGASEDARAECDRRMNRPHQSDEDIMNQYPGLHR